MREIADHVGVSTSTVSRVLSGKSPSSASPKTARQILSAAQELGYRPDPWAASLRTQRTRAVGLLLPRLADDLLAIAFEAIERAASTQDYQILVAATGDDPVEQRRRIALLEGRRVDGFIIMTANVGDEAYFASLRGRGLRFILANRGVGDQPVIRADDREGGRQATRHLLALGHRRIGVIAGPPAAPTARERVLGYREAVDQAGIEPDPQLVVHSGILVEDGVLAARRLLATGHPPTAIFAVNDLTAYGAMGAVREAGLRVGQDVALVGYNDLPLSARLPVPLSSVQHPVEEMGRLAFEGLVTQLEGGTSASVTLPVRLMVRGSSLGGG